MGICYSQNKYFTQTPFDSALVKYGYLIKIYVKPKEKGLAYPRDYFYFNETPNITKKTSAKDLLKKDGTILNVLSFRLKESDIYQDVDSLKHMYSDFESNPILSKKVGNSSIIKIYRVAIVYSKTETKYIKINKYTEMMRQPSRVSYFHREKKLLDQNIKLIKPEFIAPLKRY